MRDYLIDPPPGRILEVERKFTGSRLSGSVSLQSAAFEFGPFAHHPEATLDYSIDWSGWLAPGDTIDTVSVSCDYAEVESHSVTGNIVRAIITGAVPLADCELTFEITTTSGLVDYRTIVLDVLGGRLPLKVVDVDGGSSLPLGTNLVDGGGASSLITNFYDGGDAGGGCELC